MKGEREEEEEKEEVQEEVSYSIMVQGWWVKSFSRPPTPEPLGVSHWCPADCRWALSRGGDLWPLSCTV